VLAWRNEFNVHGGVRIPAVKPPERTLVYLILANKVLARHTESPSLPPRVYTYDDGFTTGTLFGFFSAGVVLLFYGIYTGGFD
jgi:hypothetical protein